MEIKGQELVQVKKTKFVEMYWNEENKRLVMWTHLDGFGRKDVVIPINKMPQVIRGLFSAYQRFHKRGYVKARKKNKRVAKSEEAFN